MTRTIPSIALMMSALVAALPAQAQEIHVQTKYPPLQLADSTPGGAHPAGGLALSFVSSANPLLEAMGAKIVLHASGKVPPFDAGSIEEPIVDASKWGNLVEAVADGPSAGGLAATIGISVDTKLGFGEFFTAGIPFGLSASEWMAFLYGGGGVELLQEFYDEAFDNKVKVIPIGMSPSQTAGFFPQPIPAAGAGKTAEQALAEFCATPMIIRYPNGARYIIEESCAAVGETIDFIGQQTRCEDPAAQCGPANPDNKVINDPERLTFGGFVPAAIPHSVYANGNIDAFELAEPSSHVAFFKLVTGQATVPDAEADFSSIVPKHHYTTSWAQTRLLSELVINKAEWGKLSPEVQIAIETAAKASVLSSYSDRLAAQGNAMVVLERNGALTLEWPTEMIDLFKANSAVALDKLAAEFAEKGDTSLERTLAAVRAFKANGASFFDADDVAQGSAALPQYP